MECGLQWKDITCWDDVPRLTLTHEETLETAIADYCPDMGRVVETCGQLCLRSVTAQGGGVELRGTVRVTVLYTSEESVGLRSLTQNVPFTCGAENRPLSECQVLWATGRLLLCEAQALTPRRLAVRIMPEWTICGYKCATVRLCTGVEEEPSLRLRRQERELCLTCAMAERECSVSGETAVPAGQPVPEDLLAYRLYPQVDSCQIVGTKLLVKGDITLHALYRCQQQKLHTYTATLPFSQIVESPGNGEDGDVTAAVQCICGEARLLRSEESSGFAVTAELRLLQHAVRFEAGDGGDPPPHVAGASGAAGGGAAPGFRAAAALRVHSGHGLCALRGGGRHALRQSAAAPAVSGRGGSPGGHGADDADPLAGGGGLHPLGRAGGGVHRHGLRFAADGLRCACRHPKADGAHRHRCADAAPAGGERASIAGHAPPAGRGDAVGRGEAVQNGRGADPHGESAGGGRAAGENAADPASAVNFR